MYVLCTEHYVLYMHVLVLLRGRVLLADKSSPAALHALSRLDSNCPC